QFLQNIALANGKSRRCCLFVYRLPCSRRFFDSEPLPDTTSHFTWHRGWTPPASGSKAYSSRAGRSGLISALVSHALFFIHRYPGSWAHFLEPSCPGHRSRAFLLAACKRLRGFPLIRSSGGLPIRD